MNRNDITNSEIIVEEEKIDWVHEWKSLKNNKIVRVALVAILGFMKKMKGGKDEENKKGIK